MDNQDHLGIVLALLAVNLLIALVLFVVGIFSPRGKRCERILFAVLTALCPVVMPLFLAVTRVIEWPASRKEVDMADISFNQQREEATETSDYSTEMNYVALQDAMRLSSIQDLRRLLINVMKYNSRMSLTSVAEAINSPDTETSHFAASAIQDALSEFRGTAQKFIADMEKYPEDVEINLQALDYIYDSLMLKIMTPIEYQAYVYTENNVAENLFQHNIWFMTATHYLRMTELMISIPDLDTADLWVRRAMEFRPEALETYKARLRLYFAQGNRPLFFDCIDEFKNTNIKADQEMLELIRLYQK